MTVLETEAPERPLPTLSPELLPGLPKREAVLFCPNLSELAISPFQRADRHLLEMTQALLARDVDDFNMAKQQLVSLIKKHGEPITQWNPLILELNEPELLQGAQLSGINLDMVMLRSPFGRISLAGTVLQNAGFLCADLSQLDLAEADLSSADLRYADLRDVDLTRAQLVGANLSHAKLSFANLHEANLYCARLNGALLKQADLTEAILRKADLRNSELYQANLSRARLQQADLRESNLFMANLTGVRLRQADLRNAYLAFSSLREARMQQARLTGADLTSADLTLADLQRCRLENVLLDRALFQGVRLRYAELQGANLSEVQELAQANLNNAVFDETTAFPAGFKPAQAALISRKTQPGLLRITRLLSRLPLVRRPAPRPSAVPTASH